VERCPHTLQNLASTGMLVPQFVQAEVCCI
jgi:hypothetical protein